jgi:hypothetical protein
VYVRTVKVPSSSGNVHEYVRVVESYREDGKVRQRTIADLGREDLLQKLLPQRERVLKGLPKVEGQGDDVEVLQAATWGPVRVVRALFDQLGLWEMLEDLAAIAITTGGCATGRSSSSSIPYDWSGSSVWRGSTRWPRASSTSPLRTRWRCTRS